MAKRKHLVNQLKRSELGYRIWPRMVLAKALDHPDRLRLRRTGDVAPGALEHAEGQSPEDGKVFRPMIAPIARPILVEGHV